MCRMGIFFSDAESGRKMLASELLDQEDGAGLYSVTKRILIKHQELYASSFAPLMSEEILPVMVHARSRTTGPLTSENCQPFKVGSRVLAHNGTISKESFPQVKVTLDDPQVVEKLVQFEQSSDSRLLAELLADKTIEQADRILEAISRYNNFFFYSEEEEKFLVKGIFQILYAKPVTAKIVAVTRERIPNAFAFRGTVHIAKDGTVVHRRIQPYKEDVTSWHYPHNKTQSQESHQPSLFG